VRHLGIRCFIVPGTKPAQWPSVISLRASLNSQTVFISLGIHPWYISNPQEEVERLESAIRTIPIVAIGEIGLDFYQSNQERPSRELQIESFRVQLELARKYKLPVIIHSVKAHNEVLTILKELKVTQGVIHAFSGSYEIAKAYVDCGFCLGVGPLILKSKKTQEAIRKVPMDRLLLETDAPYMVNKQLPSYNPLNGLIEVATMLAELRKVSLVEVKNVVYQNTNRVFRLV